MVRPFPPTAGALHSKTSDLVVIDEPWAFDLIRGRELDQAVNTTQPTKPNAQVWKVSTAGDANSYWWLGTVEAGRAAALADRREGIAFFEWACPRISTRPPRPRGRSTIRPTGSLSAMRRWWRRSRLLGPDGVRAGVRQSMGRHHGPRYPAEGVAGDAPMSAKPSHLTASSVSPSMSPWTGPTPRSWRRG